MLGQADAQSLQLPAQLLDYLPVGRCAALTLQPQELVLDERPQLDHGARERLGRAIGNDSAPRAWRHREPREVDQSGQFAADPGRAVEIERVQLADVVRYQRTRAAHL